MAKNRVFFERWINHRVRAHFFFIFF